MKQIGFDKKFSLLAQEAHLTKNTLLSGFDLLLKANFFQDKDGYFYSAFFHLSIGMERLLKLAVVTHHMLTNNYQTPTTKQLKGFGHKIDVLYEECIRLKPIYSHPNAVAPTLTANDEVLLNFISEYGDGARYFNLNEICEAKMDRSPLYKWLDLARATYEDYTPHQVRERSALNLMYRMDREGPPNGFTSHLDEHGHPMMVFDCLHRQYVIEKSAPLVLWRLIEMLRPIHFLLTGMAHKASEYEAANGISSMVIPHYEDFFPFLLAHKDSIKRRKRWLDIFHS
ncbi:hypothetical protein [Ralstonia solanacearum]|uniref:hypothetical protein n=1 Tax=Ralstonia solanacearum TaxID=305 RepID=UPI0005020A50|nr:hypothetical protein [Ralstonia solanacearum]KFX80704.1 hypothetical protein KR98_02695 [Ralstonia solanacearum]OCQ64623.1 hypothetical protein AR465_11230 [Ralstonia solanacearum]